MSYPRRNLTLWVLALCLLLSMGVSPAFARPQAASGDTSSTRQKAKKGRKIKGDGVGCRARSAAPAPTPAASTPGAIRPTPLRRPRRRPPKNQDGIRKFQP